jgi:hypothetical protein
MWGHFPERARWLVWAEAVRSEEICAWSRREGMWT